VTKHKIAEAIAKHIPALDLYVPPARKPWMSEKARMGIFDAAAWRGCFLIRLATVESRIDEVRSLRDGLVSFGKKRLQPERGKSKMVVSDNGSELGLITPRRLALHRSGQTHAECLHRELQWALKR